LFAGGILYLIGWWIKQSLH